ncbi:MAG: UDP-N-acetylglucosamine 1-carboxyvinyltransferase [Patescibacteria group bacterium]
MSSFLVAGFGHKKILSGELPVNGAKNSVLKAQAASLLFRESVLLQNTPFIEDVFRMNDVLESLGVSIDQVEKKSFRFDLPNEIGSDLNNDIAKKFRASIVLSGPILARTGRVSFPHPGGCLIGKRPIDVFLEAYQKMGAKIKIHKDSFLLEANRLQGADIFFKLPSVTATETLMMAAVLAKGVTILYNCACEPEVVCLAEFLNSSGANIKGAGTHTIIIRGTGLLKNGVFNAPPDRIEAGSFAVVAALCGKKIKVTNCDPSHMMAVTHSLKNMGVAVEVGKNFLLIKAPSKIRPIDLKTREYPGFPTDLQAPFSIILTQAEGQSTIFETIFEGRLSYLNDLERMGAEIVLCDPHRAIINGPTQLRGREMESPDLRAGLAFLIAGLIAKGNSVVHNAYNIDRGYEKIENRLNAVGAEIKRVD